MFGKPNKSPAGKNQDPAPVQQLQRLAVAYSAAAQEPEPEPAPEATSSISSGMTVVGKIVGEGTVKIFGRVEGEVHASAVVVAAGAHVVGDIVADDLTIGGGVKGTIHANRVKLDGSAVVEGDIFHRSLSIEENARFEGTSRREENVVDARVPLGRPQSSGQTQGQTQVAAVESGRKLNGAPDHEGHAVSAAG
jgi:cytoskeletal protein CcmA (bactofilin family)